MSPWQLALTAGGIALAVAVVAIVVMFNLLVIRRRMIREAWANVLAALSQRHALIPSLVATADAGARHELELQLSAARARVQPASSGADASDASGAASSGAAFSGPTPVAVGQAEAQLSAQLRAVLEGYPQLRAVAGFSQLMADLVQLEGDVQGSRLIYNRAVAGYTRLQRSFPVSLVSDLFAFAPVGFFELSADALAVAAVPPAVPDAQQR